MAELDFTGLAEEWTRRLNEALDVGYQNGLRAGRAEGRAKLKRQRRELRRLNYAIRSMSAFLSGRWGEYSKQHQGMLWWDIRKAVGATTMDVSNAEVVARVKRAVDRAALVPKSGASVPGKGTD